jgi:cytochrome c oxidase cbb3-type subunit 4
MVLRILVTLLSFAAFIGIVAWAWSLRNKKRFAEAAQLPFVESMPARGDDPPPPAPTASTRGESSHG